MKRHTIAAVAAALLISGALFSAPPFMATASAASAIATDAEKEGKYNYPVFDGEAKINAVIKKIVEKAKRDNQKNAALVSGGTDAAVGRDDEKYIAVALRHHDYCGGAHGMYYTEYLVFDRKTKKQLDYTAFVPKITAKELYRGVKRGLLKVTDRTGEHQSDAPFFDEKAARVSKNFRLNDDGSISLCYPVYELDCYAAGETYIRLTPELVRQLKAAANESE